MPVDLTFAGAAGLKSLAAAKIASAASKIAASHALGLAKYSTIAAAEAAKTQANLETYVYGAPVSKTPPLLSPALPPITVPLAVSPFALARGAIGVAPFGHQGMMQTPMGPFGGSTPVAAWQQGYAHQGFPGQPGFPQAGYAQPTAQQGWAPQVTATTFPGPAKLLPQPVMMSFDAAALVAGGVCRQSQISNFL